MCGDSLTINFLIVQSIWILGLQIISFPALHTWRWPNLSMCSEFLQLIVPFGMTCSSPYVRKRFFIPKAHKQSELECKKINILRLSL